MDNQPAEYINTWTSYIMKSLIPAWLILIAQEMAVPLFFSPSPFLPFSLSSFISLYFFLLVFTVEVQLKGWERSYIASTQNSSFSNCLPSPSESSVSPITEPDRVAINNSPSSNLNPSELKDGRFYMWGHSSSLFPIRNLIKSVPMDFPYLFPF